MNKQEITRVTKTFASVAGQMVVTMREMFPKELLAQLEEATRSGYTTELSFGGWEDGAYSITYYMKRNESERILVASMPINPRAGN